jgi:hypothetical protein
VPENVFDAVVAAQVRSAEIVPVPSGVMVWVADPPAGTDIVPDDDTGRFPFCHVRPSDRVASITEG